MTSTLASHSSTSSSDPSLPPGRTVADVAPMRSAVPPGHDAGSTGRRWPLWGAAAGVLGAVGTLITDTQGALYEDGVTLGDDAIREVERAGYHIGIVAGLAATLCLLVVAAGWRRWGAERAPHSLAARVVPMALTASAGAMILGYGMKGSLAVYLPGGMDEGTFTDEGLFSVFMFLDFAPYVAWWGVCFAAMATIWLALRERTLPRWLGVVSVPFVVAPVAFMAATGLPGFPGVVDQLWLAITSLGLTPSLRRHHPAPA